MASAAAAAAGGTGYCSQTSWALRRLGGGALPSAAAPRRRSFSVSAAAGFDNQNREYVIVGGGNAAGYAARTFVEHGMADGRLCIVSKEAVLPYERPALTKGYLFPPEKKPARLPGFHTCVGSGGQRQTAEWYKENGIEVLYEDPVAAFDGKTQTLKTSSGKILKYGSLIISTGCAAARLPEKIGGNLPGVHYIRDVADADSLVSSLGNAKNFFVIGGGYIGMEVAAAACGWNLDTTIIFPEDHIMPRLFTPSLAKKYEELYEQNGVKFVKGALIDKLDAGSDGRVSSAVLKDGSVVEADTTMIPITISRVNQFDAARLDVEMSAMLKEQLVKVFSLMKPGLLFQYEPELDAFLEFLIWRFSIWVDKPTPGNALMNLRYRDERAAPIAGKEVRTGLEGPGLSVSQKILYCISTVGGQYLLSRLQSFSAFRRWGDSEQRPLARRAWGLVQHAEGLYRAVSFFNLLSFLYGGRYKTIVERILKARLVYGSPNMNRAVSFEYMNRQLVWNEFSEMLLLLLPLLNSSSVKKFLLPFSKDKSASSSGDEANCPICVSNPSIPFVALPCQHRYCYYCLRTRCAATSSYRCARCNEAVVAIQRHGSS